MENSHTESGFYHEELHGATDQNGDNGNFRIPIKKLHISLQMTDRKRERETGA